MNGKIRSCLGLTALAVALGAAEPSPKITVFVYNYAAIPGSSTTFYTRSGYTSGAQDALEVKFKLDVGTSQVAGDYQNTVTVTATAIP